MYAKISQTAESIVPKLRGILGYLEGVRAGWGDINYCRRNDTKKILNTPKHIYVNSQL